jgi:hypothetical protein
MRFRICRSSDQYIPGSQPIPEAVLVGEDWYIDIEPGAILNLAARLGKRIIVTATTMPPELEIYDDYRE